MAIDDDADAIAAARENLALNPEARVTLEVIDFRIPDPESRIPAAVRRRRREPDRRSPDRRRRNCGRSPGLPAVFVLSGFMDHEERDVLRAFAGLDVEWRDQEDEWVCLELSPDRK